MHSESTTPPAIPPAAPPPPAIVVMRGKSAGLATILSFFWCGLGQLYNGDILKGLIFMALYALSWVSLAIVIGFLTTPLLWVIGMVDAHRTAERINREQAAGLR